MKPARRRNGFTLLELLVVIGLIAALSTVLFLGSRGAGQGSALYAAQATTADLLAAARLKATATGRQCRVLVAVDPADPERYLRFLVMQLARQPGANPGTWDTLHAYTLAAGAYVVPASLATIPGLVATPGEWRRVSDPAEELASGVLRNQSINLALEGDEVARSWTGVSFTANGTLTALAGGPPPRGLLVIAPGIRRTPGSYANGESPVQLRAPAAVRGLVLSAYGVPALLNDRDSF